MPPDDTDLPGLDDDAPEPSDVDPLDRVDDALSEWESDLDAKASARDQANAELDEWFERVGEHVHVPKELESWDRLGVEAKTRIRQNWESAARNRLTTRPRWVFVGGGFGILGLVLMAGFFFFNGDAEDPVVAPTSTTAAVGNTEAPVDSTPPPAAASVTVTVDPGEGPSGTTGTITVKGERNQIVIVEVRQPSGSEYQLSGNTGGDGTYTVTANFSGQVGDVITIEATVGPMEDSPTGSTTFTITALPDTSFLVALGVTFDGANHRQFVGMPNEITLQVRYGSITIEGPPPFVAVSGEVDVDGTFSTTGRGTVAGFADIAVTMVGTVSPTGLDAEYSMGTEGGLPTGAPITYSMVGTPVAEPPADRTAEVADFYEVLNSAQAAGDASTMGVLLHPAVLTLYGSEQCSTYLAGVVNPAVVFTPIDVGEFGVWQWERDGMITIVDDALTVTVNVTVAGEDQGDVEAHIAYDGDDLAWFTDCGEPISG